MSFFALVHGGSPSSSLQQCLGHFLDGYNETKMFVLTEGPDDMTASRFWDIVWHQNCTFIIMLTPRDSEDVSVGGLMGVVCFFFFFFFF